MKKFTGSNDIGASNVSSHFSHSNCMVLLMPILLISATEDEIAPTTLMCNKIINRLKQHNFQYYTEHIATVGSHTESLKHFELVFNFLKHKFPVKK